MEIDPDDSNDDAEEELHGICEDCECDCVDCECDDGGCDTCGCDAENNILY